MVLVDWQIRELCKEGLVNPFDPGLIDACSLDIRVGSTAMYDTTYGFEKFDFSGFNDNNPYFMKPNELLLVSTLETFKIPVDVSPNIQLKSSRAREGFGHSLSGRVKNGFQGVLTLELKNYSTKHNIAIYPGMRICYLTFDKTSTPEKPYSGRYAGYNTVMGSLDRI